LQNIKTIYNPNLTESPKGKVGSYFPFKIILIFPLLLFFNVTLPAQKIPFSFQQESIPIILKKIEQQTKLVFNYDPALLKDYQFSGKLSTQDVEQSLEKLLYQTPYTFEKDQSTVLIFLPEPKRYTLCGTIKDQQNNTTLPFVNIYLQGRNRGTQSDEHGNYEWTFTAYKNQQVQYSYVGYEAATRIVQELDRADCTDIYLDIDAHLFGGEIIVTDYILDGITEGTSYSSVTLDYDLLQSRQSIVEHDVLRNVQLLPGISSVDESATNLRIRGSTPDQNLVIWEGATLYDPGHVFGMISAINPFVVEKVQVFKGVFDPQYDNRVGGIVDLSLNDSIANRFEGGIGTTFSEAHAYLEVPIIPDKLSYLLSGRKTINGLLESPTLTSYTSKIFQNSKIEEQEEEFEEEEFEANQQLNYYDYNGKLIFQPSENIHFSTSFFKSHNDFSYNAELVEDQLASTDRLLFDAFALNTSLEFNFFKKGQTTLSYTSSSYDNNYEVYFIETESDQIFQNNEVFNRIEDQTFSISNHWQFNPALAIQLGYNRNKKSVHFDFSINNDDEPDYEDFNFSEGTFNHLYTSFQYNKGSLQLNGGLRMTHFIELENWAFSPRLNAQYAINKSLKIKAAAGIFQQYISQLKEFGENELGLNNKVWILNNTEGDNLFIKANKASAGFVYHQNGWLIDVEGYYQSNTGLSTLTPLFQTSITLADDYSTGSSISKGLDVLLNKRINDYTIWFNYSLNKSTFLFPDILAESFPATNDQRHTLSLINNWKYKNWTFSLSYQYKSGLPYSQPEDIVPFIEEDTGDLEYFLDYEALNQNRLPNYSRLDFGINYRPTFKRLPFKAEFNLSILNLLNRTNLFSKDFYLADLEDTDGIPEWYDIEKRLLQRTPQLVVRVYW